MENNGWVKMHRSMLKWEWYQDANTSRVFFHILMSANYEDGRWQGIDVKRGELITGRKSLAKALGISERSVRTSLEHLKSTNEIAIRTTNKYSIIQIQNYDHYQNIDQQNVQPAVTQATSNRPATDHKQEVKKNKNIKKEETAPLSSEVLEYFNKETGKNFKSVTGFEKNLEFWLTQYTMDEIKQAICNIVKDKFWKEKMDIVMLFRRKNPRGEDVDYIGQLLQLGQKSTKEVKRISDLL